MYLWDVLARRERAKRKVWTDSAQEGRVVAAASVLRNVVMDGTGKCKRTQCGPIEDDVKHRMAGEEGEYARGRREDCV